MSVYFPKKMVRELPPEKFRFNPMQSIHNLTDLQVLHQDDWHSLITDIGAIATLSVGKAEYVGCLVWALTEE